MTIIEPSLDSYFVLRRLPFLKQRLQKFNYSRKYDLWEYSCKVGDRLAENHLVFPSDYTDVGLYSFERPLKDWAAEVKRYRTSGDQWRLNAEQRQRMGRFSATKGDNDHFTALEISEIRSMLTGMVEYADEDLRVPGEKLAELALKIDYLSSSLDRMGRIDWRNAAVGALVGLGLATVLTPEQVRELLFWLAKSMEQLTSLPGM